MNNDPSETKLENLLRGLVPDAPSPRLMQQIEEELKLDMSWLNATARPRRRVNWVTPVSWSAIGAAAAVAVMSIMPLQPSGGTFQSATTLAAAPVTTAPVLPVSTTISEWEDTKSEPAPQYVHVGPANGQAWHNSRDRAMMILEYPEQRALALPVNFLSEAPFPLPDLPLNQQ